MSLTPAGRQAFEMALAPLPDKNAGLGQVRLGHDRDCAPCGQRVGRRDLQISVIAVIRGARATV